jgi:16S rRNA (cytidine1402-2'-O)-methyltransferase
MAEGRLYVCATPIGNLGDVSERLRRTLTEVDAVYAEDSRRVAKLLAHLGVEVGVRSLFSGNEKSRSEELIARLESGMRVALVSDAGTPAVSDPGAWVVSLAHERGIPVTVIPGPSSVLTALALSGFPADRFVFEGFLPRRGKDRSARLAGLASEDRTAVVFASPRRLGDDLQAMLGVMGPGRRVAVTRELTKLHEEVWVGSLAEAVERWGGEVKGEVTIVVAPRVTPPGQDLDGAVSTARSLVEAGESVSEAARRVAEETGVSRRVIYQALVAGQG